MMNTLSIPTDALKATQKDIQREKDPSDNIPAEIWYDPTPVLDDMEIELHQALVDKHDEIYRLIDIDEEIIEQLHAMKEWLEDSSYKIRDNYVTNTAHHSKKISSMPVQTKKNRRSKAIINYEK